MNNNFYLKDLTLKEIKAELDEVHVTSALVFATVCVNKFKRGCIFTKDCLRRHVEVTMYKMIDKVPYIKLNFRQIHLKSLLNF